MVVTLRAITEKGHQLLGKNGVTSSVSAPGDTKVSDATEPILKGWRGIE